MKQTEIVSASILHSLNNHLWICPLSFNVKTTLRQLMELIWSYEPTWIYFNMRLDFNEDSTFKLSQANKFSWWYNYIYMYGYILTIDGENKNWLYSQGVVWTLRIADNSMIWLSSWIHFISADLKMSCAIFIPSPMHKYMCANFYPCHFEFWKLCIMLIVYSVISSCGVLMKWWLYIFLRQENQRSARYWHTVSVWRGLSTAQL